MSLLVHQSAERSERTATHISSLGKREKTRTAASIVFSDSFKSSQDSSILLKTWRVFDGSVSLFFNWQKEVYAKFFGQEGCSTLFKHAITGLPRSISKEPQTIKNYLKDSRVKLKNCSDESYSLEILMRIRGGLSSSLPNEFLELDEASEYCDAFKELASLVFNIANPVLYRSICKKFISIAEGINFLEGISNDFDGFVIPKELLDVVKIYSDKMQIIWRTVDGEKKDLIGERVAADLVRIGKRKKNYSKELKEELRVLFSLKTIMLNDMTHGQQFYSLVENSTPSFVQYGGEINDKEILDLEKELMEKTDQEDIFYFFDKIDGIMRGSVGLPEQEDIQKDIQDYDLCIGEIVNYLKDNITTLYEIRKALQRGADWEDVDCNFTEKIGILEENYKKKQSEILKEVVHTATFISCICEPVIKGVNASKLMLKFSQIERSLMIANGKNVVLMQGATGAGKSTLTATLMGAKLKPISKKIDYRTNEGSGFPPIGHSSSMSKTDIVECYKVDQHLFVFGDSPGFEDTKKDSLLFYLTLDHVVVQSEGIQGVVLVVNWQTFPADRTTITVKLFTTIKKLFPDIENIDEDIDFPLCVVFSHSTNDSSAEFKDMLLENKTLYNDSCQKEPNKKIWKLLSFLNKKGRVVFFEPFNPVQHKMLKEKIENFPVLDISAYKPILSSSDHELLRFLDGTNEERVTSAELRWELGKKVEVLVDTWMVRIFANYEEIQREVARTQKDVELYKRESEMLVKSIAIDKKILALHIATLKQIREVKENHPLGKKWAQPNTIYRGNALGEIKEIVKQHAESKLEALGTRSILLSNLHVDVENLLSQSEEEIRDLKEMLLYLRNKILELKNKKYSKVAYTFPPDKETKVIKEVLDRKKVKKAWQEFALPPHSSFRVSLMDVNNSPEGSCFDFLSIHLNCKVWKIKVTKECAKFEMGVNKDTTTKRKISSLINYCWENEKKPKCKILVTHTGADYNEVAISLLSDRIVHTSQDLKFMKQRIESGVGERIKFQVKELKTFFSSRPRLVTMQKYYQTQSNGLKLRKEAILIDKKHVDKRLKTVRSGAEEILKKRQWQDKDQSDLDKAHTVNIDALKELVASSVDKLEVLRRDFERTEKLLVDLECQLESLSYFITDNKDAYSCLRRVCNRILEESLNPGMGSYKPDIDGEFYKGTVLEVCDKFIKMHESYEEIFNRLKENE